jgi:hypothetical protein
MKKYVAFSQDLSADMPPRHLLVATQAFWNDSDVKKDSIYQQVLQAVANGQPFPNDLTPQQQMEIGHGVCNALKATLPTYKC